MSKLQQFIATNLPTSRSSPSLAILNKNQNNEKRNSFYEDLNKFKSTGGDDGLMSTAGKISSSSSYSINASLNNLNYENSSSHLNLNKISSYETESLDVDDKYLKTKNNNNNRNYSLIDVNSKRYSSINITDFFNLDKKLMQTSKIFYKRKSASSQSALTFQTILFILIGVFFGFCLATWLRMRLLNCKSGHACCPNGILLDDIVLEDRNSPSLIQSRSIHLNDNPNGNNNIKIYTDIEPDKNLVFIGVMTAQKYLETRAKSVYKTWAKSIPGKISFFSRSGSSSIFNLPLVSLPGVDDSYPPQKKSFMMLKFMHDNYLDKFEWFMRVDDDVYIKPDKLEQFLRSLNSTIPQFIGQAGLGNKDEFGLLSLDYDENFCMGGPGIVMSRETLRLVVPHISYCLKNLYSTHEDVEIGRCVRKFANISCTWSYEMQHIFHHNSSGNEAFTGDLLSKEVLKATSLHPVKQFKYQFRLHNFFHQRKIIDLRHRYLQLEREVFKLKNELFNEDLAYRGDADSNNKKKLKKIVQLDRNQNEILLNKNENLSENAIENRFKLTSSLKNVKIPKNRKDRHDFDFFTRSLFSSTYISPKRGLEGYWRRTLTDSIRQIMDVMNLRSVERGRLIEFKDILYGNVRHHPLIGLDYIIDILLIYRKYEGRKMTVPVRRHAYIRNTFTTMLFREDNLYSSLWIDIPDKYRNNYETNLDSNQNVQLENENNQNGFVQNILNFLIPSRQKRNNKMSKPDLINMINGRFKRDTSLLTTSLKLENVADLFKVNKIISDKIIHFVLPLTGRWEIFLRFMQNYEDVCLKTNENTKLVVVLFENLNETLLNDNKFIKQSDLIRDLFKSLKLKYNLKLKDESLQLIVNRSSFSRSIGCELGASLFTIDDLIFFIDVDIYFTSDFLLRARLNTIKNKQVYYPIVFSEYDPDDIIDSIRILSNSTNKQEHTQRVRQSHFDFSSDNGYWRQFGFGIVATYYADLKLVGGFDTSIVGWGKEDVDLYEKFVKSNLTIFRTVDPGLTHVFHKIECDSNLAEEQMIMCLGSKSTSIASQRVLSKLIYEKKTYLIQPKVEIVSSQSTTSTKINETKVLLNDNNLNEANKEKNKQKVK